MYACVGVESMLSSSEKSDYGWIPTTRLFVNYSCPEEVQVWNMIRR